MAFRNIKRITALCQPGTKLEAIFAVHAAITSILDLAGVLQEYNNLYHGGGSYTYLGHTSWQTYRYIRTGEKESKLKGYLNSTVMLDSVRDDPARIKDPGYDILVVRDPLHWHSDSDRIVSGIGRAGQGAVVSYANFAHLLQPVLGESDKDKKNRIVRFIRLLKMLVIHELCHVFGLFPYAGPANASDEDLKNAHCQNECIMVWEFNEDLLDRIEKKPLCDSCSGKPKEFFNEPPQP